jgi:hypothetical protein
MTKAPSSRKLFTSSGALEDTVGSDCHPSQFLFYPIHTKEKAQEIWFRFIAERLAHLCLR